MPSAWLISAAPAAPTRVPHSNVMIIMRINMMIIVMIIMRINMMIIVMIIMRINVMMVRIIVIVMTRKMETITSLNRFKSLLVQISLYIFIHEVK